MGALISKNNLVFHEIQHVNFIICVKIYNNLIHIQIELRNFFQLDHIMNQEPNIFIKIWHFLTLKIYHRNLLTSGGSTYLSIISFIMILAALSEGFAWGFLGSTLTPERPSLGWVILGSFVFLLMWFFDRSLASADLLKEEHEKTLNGQTFSKSISLTSIKQNFSSILRTYIPFVIRIGVVVASLVITAPFLTQLAFKADIENKCRFTD